MGFTGPWCLAVVVCVSACGARGGPPEVSSKASGHGIAGRPPEKHRPHAGPGEACGSPALLDQWFCEHKLDRNVHIARPEDRTRVAKALSAIHERVHDPFAKALDRLHLPPDSSFSTLIGLEVDGQTGELASLRVLEPSDNSGLDAAALIAFRLGAPFPKDPLQKALAPGQSHLFFTWRLHARRTWACSDYFATPYLPLPFVQKNGS